MSRIEQALEKAALLRAKFEEATVPSTENPSSLGSPLPKPPAVEREAAINVTDRVLVTATDPYSPAAEEYRKLKSLLVNLTRGDRFDNTMMVTSSLGCEGKTVTSINLAITLAQEFDHTVLLVDADLRKPSVAEYLGVRKAPGLSNCLQEGVDIGDVLVKTGIGRLSILPGGEAVPNPAELFSSQRMKDLVVEMKNRYPDRYIIFDAPPVLPFAETRSLAANVDGIVFVVSEGGATQEEIGEALQALKVGKILGLVFNGATGDTGHGRYGYYYRLSEKSPADIREPELKAKPVGRNILKRLLGKAKR